MKATKLFTTAAVATLGLTLLAPAVLAATPEEEAEAAKTLVGKGKVTYKESNTKTDKGDPEEETVIDIPGEENENGGPLRVDFVSELNFGIRDIKTGGDTAYAAAAIDKNDGRVRGNLVQVTDSRGAGDDGAAKGWTLKAQMTRQFETADKKSKIKAASISYLNPVLTYKNGKGSVADPRPDLTVDNTKYKANGSAVLTFDEDAQTGNSETMLEAFKGNGFGTYYLQFGRNKDYSKQDDTTAKSVELTVPAGTPLKAAEYTSDITWTINEL